MAKSVTKAEQPKTESKPDLYSEIEEIASRFNATVGSTSRSDGTITITVVTRSK